MRSCSSVVSKIIRLAAAAAVLAACNPAALTPRSADEAPPILRGSGQRLALLVGIDEYPQSLTPGVMPWRKLNTRRELADLRKVLRDRYGFRDADIVTMTEKDTGKVPKASAAGIRAMFRSHLIQQAKPGAVVIFHFSGHGQQVADDDGTDQEADGRDETLVPADSVDQRASQGAKVNLRDDEIGKWLKELQGRMTHPDGRFEGSINVFVDSCHSGTVARGDLVERGRGWDVDIDGPEPPAPAAAAPQERGQSRSESIVDQPGAYVLLSAAQADQTAKEIGDIGIFSRALVGALSRATSQTTYRSLYEEIRKEVQNTVGNQLPQYEGNIDQYVFGGAAPSPMPHVRVQVVRGELVLQAGTLHLVSVGSLYELHRPGVEPMTKETLLAEAEVSATAAERSMLRLRQVPGKPLPAVTSLGGVRAHETVHGYETQKLQVRLPSKELPPAIAQAVRASPLVVEHRAAAATYDAKLMYSRGRVELYRPESGCPVAQLAMGARPSEEEVAKVIDWLKREWRWRQLYQLQQDNRDVKAELKLVPVQAVIGPSGHIEGEPRPRSDLAADSQLQLKDGEHFMLELTNPTPYPVWVTLLMLSQNGEISVLFPKTEAPGDGQIKIGTTRQSNRYVFETERPFGRSLIKVIATREQVDLSSLVQAAAEQGRGGRSASEAGLLELDARSMDLPGNTGPLAQILTAAAAGVARTKNVGLPIGSWGVSEAQLDVSPRLPVAGSRSSSRAAAAAVAPGTARVCECPWEEAGAGVTARRCAEAAGSAGPRPAPGLGRSDRRAPAPGG